MSEAVGNATEGNLETVQRNDAMLSRLRKISGSEKVDPSTFGISPEKVSDIFSRFIRRALSETDIPSIVDGIIPPELIFDPDIAEGTLQAKTGPAFIKARGGLYKRGRNLLEAICGEIKSEAYFNKRSRKINVFPRLDKFSTVVAIAKGNLSYIVGPSIAHEAVHAHQAIKEGFDFIHLPERLREAAWLRQNDPELSESEVRGLIDQSIDLTILNEVQAYLLEYSLTGGAGGTARPGIVSAYKNKLTQYQEGEHGKLAEQDLLEDVDHEIEATSIAFLGQKGFGGIPLQLYSKNGYAPIRELVVSKTKRYLPKSYQDQQKAVRRIKAALLQMIRLLDKGVSHREIAESISNCGESADPGSEWDTEAEEYKFLQRAITEHPGQDKTENDLFRKFDKKTEERVMRLRNIAAEELTGKRIQDMFKNNLT